MEVETGFDFESFDRRESLKARMEAESTLDGVDDILRDMKNLYEADGYDAPEGVRLTVKDQVTSSGIQRDKVVGGVHSGRDDEGFTEIRVPWNTDVETIVHEFAHDISQNTVDMEGMDEIVNHTYQEAFCDFNSLFFGDLNGDGFEDEFEESINTYHEAFEDTFEGLWESLNPEIVDRRRTALENMEGSLEAIRDVDDEQLVGTLEDQFHSHVEDFRSALSKGARMNYFSGIVPFFVTRMDQGYQMPVNENRSEGDKEILRDMNDTLGDFPFEPVSENMPMNQSFVNYANSASERLGDISEVRNWGEFVYDFVKEKRGYADGMEEDFDIAHNVGKRIALEKYREGLLPSDMVENTDQYVERIKDDIKEVIGTWMTYEGVDRTLEDLEAGSEEREQMVSELEEASSEYDNSIASQLYEKDLSDLEDGERVEFRYMLEDLRQENDAWFTRPYS
jgi:hypothetical protein